MTTEGAYVDIHLQTGQVKLGFSTFTHVVNLLGYLFQPRQDRTKLGKIKLLEDLLPP